MSLPSEYTELPYLTFTGKQTIDTVHIPYLGLGCRLDFDVKFTNDNSEQTIFCAREDENINEWSLKKLNNNQISFKSFKNLDNPITTFTITQIDKFANGTLLYTTYAYDRFFAVGTTGLNGSGDRYYTYSFDGINWVEPMLVPSPCKFNAITSIQADFGIYYYVAIGGNGYYDAACSADGIDWVIGKILPDNLTISPSPQWSFITSSGSRILAVSTSGHYAYLDNSSITKNAEATWTFSSSQKLNYSVTVDKVVYGNNTFVILASNKIFYSKDNGVTWTLNSNANPSSYYFNDICFGNGKFVAVSWRHDSVLVSEDAVTWNYYDTGCISNSYNGNNKICFGNGKFITGNGIEIRCSTDGITWNNSHGAAWSIEGMDEVSLFDWTSISYGKNKFIISNGISNYGHLVITSLYETKTPESCIFDYSLGTDKILVTAFCGQSTYNNVLNINGTTILGYICALPSPTGSIYIGGEYKTPYQNTTRSAKMNLYNFSITERDYINSNYLWETACELIPCYRNSDNKYGYYNTVRDSFTLDNSANLIMGGLAVNVASFCNYIVSLCTYFNDATSLSDINKTQLYNYLIEGLTPGILLNIKTALAILNKINTYADSPITLSLSDDVLKHALNISTAKALVDIAFPSGNRAKFCTLDRIYDDTGNLNDYNFMNFIFYLPAASTESYTLIGTLVGGGGGGGGGLAGDGDKNSNYYGYSGKGAAGGKSTISLLNTETLEFDVQAEAAGGTEGGNRTIGSTGGDPGSVERHGYDGGAGTTTEVSIEIVRGDTIKISPGYGGGGGGGLGVSASTSSSYGASDASEAKGGDGKEANSFTGDDNVFGGGGGEGGHGTGYTTTGVGNNANSGPNANSTTKYTPSYQSNGIGGIGGWTTLTDDSERTSNSNQPTTIGAGGYGGIGKNWQDTSTHGNGGNGGNSGGFIINSESSAASALFIWKQ